MFTSRVLDLGALPFGANLSGRVHSDDGAPLAFAPTQLANLKAWYRADLLITLNSTTVSGWGDSSGTGDSNKNLVQATGGSQPTYNATDAAYNNKPTLSFSSSQMHSGTWASALTQAFTVYVVGNVTAVSGSTLFFFNSSSDKAWVISRDNGAAGPQSSLAMYAGTTLATSSLSAPQLNAKSILCCVFNGASSSGYVNSIATTYCTGQVGSVGVTDAVLGAYAGGGLALAGKMAEVIVYSGGHSATDRGTVLSYLSSRYTVTLV